MIENSAVAQYDFVGDESKHQLSFKNGDRLAVRNLEADSPWAFGELNSQLGWFPVDYVVITDGESSHTKSPTITSQQFPTTSQRPSSQNYQSTDDKVKAMYDFHATEDDEIGFKENEIIIVTKRHGDWWTGKRESDGKEGLFPSTYVEAIALNDSMPPTATDNGQSHGIEATAMDITMSKTNEIPLSEMGDLSMGMTSNTELQLEKQLSINSATGLLKELPPSLFSGMWNGGISKPMWMSWAFVDIMADPYCRKRENNSADMVALCASFDFVADGIRRMSESTSSSVHHNLHQALKQAAGFASSLPALSCNADHFHRYLSRWVSCIKRLRSNEIAIGPVGWSNSDGTGQCAVVVIHRSTAKDEYTLSFVNPEGEGSEYHVCSLDLKFGGVQRAQAIVFSGIPTWKLNNSSFWFMALRQLVFPAPSDSENKSETGAQLVYERLLPYLTTRPLYSNAVASETEGYRLNFEIPPLGGNPSKALTVLGAVEQALCLMGESEVEQKKTVLLFRLAIMHMATNELSSATSLRPADVVSLCHASRRLAREATDYVAQFPSCDTETLNEALLCSKNLKLKAQELDLVEMGRGGLANPVELPSEGLKNSTLHPLLGRLRRDASVEHLAGEAVPPPIIRPVELTLVPDTVSSFEEVGTALYNASYVCTLMGNQRDYVKHTYLHRMALITHLFIRVIPIPMPTSHPEARHRCFWQASGLLIRLETQAHILKQMELVCRHFVAASLSLKVTRSLDATRLLTMACMSAISDVVMRMEACDTPSMCCMHYSGRASGPTHPFGFEMGYFAAESEAAKLPDPALQAVRCQVLDYFYEQREVTRDDHVIFSFEHTMGFGHGEHTFLGNLCLQMGFPGFSDSDILPTYLSGEEPAILDIFPELGYFRDIVYLMKAMMVPTSAALPEVKRWTAQDARLRWKWKGEDKEKCYHVKGFGRTLECNAYTKDIGADGPPRKAYSGNVFMRIKRRIMGGRRARAPHSYANPCYLVDKAVETEDDILHVRSLPDFGDRLRAHDSELLLQYLTAPYIRIPLVMQFFADPQHLLALWSMDLQEVLEAVLFEPGAWQPARPSPLPTEIPVLDRSHLTTPCGLLFNELLKSPHSLISSLDKMLDTALEMDTGRYTTSQTGSSSVILFVVRLCVRVEEFILYLHRHDTCVKVRGLENRPQGILSYLADAQKTMRERLNKTAFPMIGQWLDRATKADDVESACILHAHLLFLFKNVSSDDLSLTVVGVLLTSQVWLMIHFRFEGEATSDAGKRKVTDSLEYTSALFISSTDVFDLVVKHRNKIMDWLCLPSNVSQRNIIMEGVVRVHTRTGDRTRAAGRNTSFVDRHWQSILRKDCRGRFVPDTEIVQVQLAEQELGSGQDANMSFLDWMRLTTQAVDLEVNAQLGEFTLKKHSMETLPLEIEAMADFQYVFGCGSQPSKSSAIGCAEVRHRTHRTWYRLVGHRHDVQLWDEDSRMCAPLVNFIRPYTSALGGEEKWIMEILEPVRSKYLHSIELFLSSTGSGESSNTYAVLAGYHIQQMADIEMERARSNTGVSGDNSGSIENSVNPVVLKQLKEVVVLRNPGVVYVYDVVEHGRRYYRSLVFSSNVNLCIADIPPCGVMDEKDWRAQLVGGDAVAPISPPRPSLVITRNLYQYIGPQMYLPTRYSTYDDAEMCA